MSKWFIFEAAAIAALCGLAAPASAADVTGTVTVTGVVTGKCTVQGGGNGNNFSGNIPLGELDASDGRLDPALEGSSIAGASLSFTVVCNTASPSISLSATTMGDNVTAGTGYTSAVDYTAQLDLAETSGSDTFKYATYPGGPATTGNLANPLSGNAANVTVSVNTCNTDQGANSSILTAGNYGSAAGGAGGVISITISPT